MVRLTDHLDMTIVIDWVVKPQNKQTNSVVLLPVSGDVGCVCQELPVSMCRVVKVSCVQNHQSKDNLYLKYQGFSYLFEVRVQGT